MNKRSKKHNKDKLLKDFFLTKAYRMAKQLLKHKHIYDRDIRHETVNPVLPYSARKILLADIHRSH